MVNRGGCPAGCPVSFYPYRNSVYGGVGRQIKPKIGNIKLGRHYAVVKAGVGNSRVKVVGRGSISGVGPKFRRKGAAKAGVGSRGRGPGILGLRGVIRQL